MKVVLAGDWHSKIHEVPLAIALEKAGANVIPFKWYPYFSGGSRPIHKFCRRFQNKYLIGPIVSKLNDDLVELVREHLPEVLFIYRGTHILAATIRQIRQIFPQIIVVAYNNDDPFSPEASPLLWRHFNASLPILDIAFAYRHKNLKDFELAGSPRSELLRSWFIPEVNRPVGPSNQDVEKYGGDIVFIGHFEDDGRDEALARLLEQGINVRLFGHIESGSSGWGKIISKHKVFSKLKDVRPLWGDEYNLALNCSPMALCFLSKLNRDTYTRRCFEIPAAGTILVSERTSDLESLFESGEEALFFSSPEELVAKVTGLKGDANRIRKMRERILSRVWADGHDIYSRGRYVMELLGGISR
ncbi:MAG: glycosyltransferase [Pseudomonadota bacterium]